jgi:hypothetical protein
MQLKSFITVGLAFAAIAVPVAQASNPLGHPGGPGSVGIVPAQSSYLGHPGGPTSVGLVPAKATSTSFRNFVGGPGSVGLIQTPSVSTSTGFAWDDAAIGSGFTVGLMLLAAAAWLATRRRATLAHSSS